MFAYIRYLILTTLVITWTVMCIQKTSAKPETDNLDDADLVEEESVSDSRQNLTCNRPNRRCKETCDCCQYGIDSYDCKVRSNRRKYCTTTLPPPLRCPNAPRPCFAIDGPCRKDCDCCQEQDKNPHRVTCYKENNSTKGLCFPHPYLIIDCFPPPPPPPPPPAPVPKP